MSEVVFVGTSDAFGAGGRRQSAILLRGSSGTVLLDCGVTTTTGLCQLGIDRNELDAIVISHFHGDHYGGIPILLLAALYEEERKHPLRIVGPVGIESRVRNLADAMCYGLEDREWSFSIEFQEFRAGQTLDVGPVRTEAFEALHQPHTQPHGLIVTSGKQRIAYSGDTGWFEELPRHVGAADLFICECTYHDHEFDYHLNHEGLVAHTHEFECGRIVLTHLGSEMANRRGQAAFETADDGTVIKL
jgi:ribonuclease BN (tRNA processing enzyme)